MHFYTRIRIAPRQKYLRICLLGLLMVSPAICLKVGQIIFRCKFTGKNSKREKEAIRIYQFH